MHCSFLPSHHRRVRTAESSFPSPTTDAQNSSSLEIKHPVFLYGSGGGSLGAGRSLARRRWEEHGEVGNGESHHCVKSLDWGLSL